VAEVYGLIWKFRNTNLATKLGMGMNDSEYIIGEKRYKGMQRLASNIHNFDMEAAIAGVQRRNAASAVGGAVMNATGAKSLLTNIQQLTGLNPGNIGQKVENGLAGARNFIAKKWMQSQFLFPEQRVKRPAAPGMGMGIMSGAFGPMADMALALGMRGQARGIGDVLEKQKGGLNMSSLSAVEANTREGFAQRSRARKEDESLKLTKQQLEVLKDIKAVLEKPSEALAPANLLGVGMP
jgi:hypothetical protein